MIEKNTEKLIRQWTLTNAIEHKGEANTDAIIGKIIAEKPELKSNIQELKERIEKTVQEVNELSIEKQKKELEKIGKPKREKKEEKGLSKLEDADKYPNIVTRFAPNPNGPLHLGHVRTAVLSHEYARRNEGKFILRFEDTNPNNAMEEFYDLIREDLKWLGLDWEEEYLQSDRLSIYYKHLESLLEEGKAYICNCKPEKFKTLRDDKKQCPCRDSDPEKNLKRWRKMLKGEYEEGDSVARIKTDLNNPNPALRDWPAFRIVSNPHPKTGDKYRVWPLYNFSVAIDDHKMGVTHVLRGKEHEVNEQRQRQLFNHLGWDYPTAIQHGRLSVSGTVLSKTKISEGIREGKYDGYDDIRLGTLAAMRRRGITPEALREIVIEIGTTRADSTLSMKTLYTKNRRIIDDQANRYFFVPKPKRLLIHNVPTRDKVKLRLHPDKQERGERVLPLDTVDDSLKVWIAAKDVEKMNKGDLIRLKDFLNFEISSKKPLEGDFESFELRDVPKIQWVSKNKTKVEVLKPDGETDTGYAEPEVGDLPKEEVIQFERYGFVKIDETEPEIKARYAHS
ncbi:hypothetical protein AKJ37_01600 [candidate division MSBL1 archaeon SCGC-AAA259I09]|uniref:Glutamate--tRNA ligase n=3 Tax=candidate division MSBL1 TaxID=215777 RepID=A0A133UV38_9EURY|nr:hypothetical protein AKJ62_03195 [candidate division MSBL1 archaeon SCGC-AAA259D14]KXA92632.1 hypothetical protein AKJ66_03820 [candidate division MSBL1 archaeon SCGC-AAA259E22]KXA98029.1 hypothetical protein AKJ37_01600 [candidate division MSBL1 archaeon SCGC-AAA259I09]